MHSKWLPKILQDKPLAEEEDNGRNEMGIDVECLVMEVPATAEREMGVLPQMRHLPFPALCPLLARWAELGDGERTPFTVAPDDM
uniref:Proto-oncogene tyrosine-protein kinase receptor Ret n=1 Tax=Talaromyces marneffei PM1 TaxID=1077442 RepID=A0A093UXW5_TALMA